MSTELPDDFWWLSPSQANEQWLMGVAHHPPLSDYYEADLSPPDAEEPTIHGWKHSARTTGDLSEDFRWYPLEFVDHWRSGCNARNVYRTMRLRSLNSVENALVGPFLIDIDNQDWTNGHSTDLDAAVDVARQVVHELVDQGLVNGRDFRIFFSGRKGINVEVTPASLGIDGDESAQIIGSSLALERIISKIELGGSIVDRIYGNRFGYRIKHPYTRLHNSLNCWQGVDGLVCRRRIELSVAELIDLPCATMIARSEAI